MTDSADWTGKLSHVSKIREPYETCAKELVSELVRESLGGSGPLVEVGAGLGQLRRWLPEEIRGRFVHTEPDGPALAEFRSAFPDASTRQSSVEALPFEDGVVSAVLGLCVFDVVQDLACALREVRRILDPRGRLIALLDLAPYRAVELETLASAGKLAFPNLFGGPFEKTWPEDLLVTDRAPMCRLLDALRPLDHPLPTIFQRYFEAALATPFDAERACTELEVISRTEPMRTLLREALRSAFEVAWKLQLEPPVGTLVSSGQHFAERLQRAALDAGFVVETNEVRAAWAHAPVTEPDVRQRSFALGQGLLEPAALAPRLCENAEPPPDDHQLVEFGMLVFVARPRVDGP